MCFFLMGLKNEFETAMVNNPSVCEPFLSYTLCFFLESVYYGGAVTAALCQSGPRQLTQGRNTRKSFILVDIAFLQEYISDFVETSLPQR